MFFQSVRIAFLLCVSPYLQSFSQPHAVCEDAARACRLLDLPHRFTAAVPHELHTWAKTIQCRPQTLNLHLTFMQRGCAHSSLPSTWWGLSLVTRFLCTCTTGSLVSSSSSSTSLVVMGHVTCDDSSTTISWSGGRSREFKTACLALKAISFPHILWRTPKTEGLRFTLFIVLNTTT